MVDLIAKKYHEEMIPGVLSYYLLLLIDFFLVYFFCCKTMNWCCGIYIK